MSRVFFTDRDRLAVIGARGWIALTHDRRIRYKPNELAAVVRHRVALLVVVCSAPYPELATAFVATLPRIESFIVRHEAPHIGKVYRPAPADRARNPAAAGRIELWYPR